jgi:hypothetical protein
MIQRYPSLAALPPALREFWQRQPNLSYDITPEWLDCYEREALEPGASVAWYGGSAGNANTPSVLFPAQILPTQGPIGAFPQLGGMANFYTSFFAPIVNRDPNILQQSLDALADFWSHEQPRWSVVDIAPMDNESAEFSGLIRALNRHGFAVKPYFRFGNWILELAGRDFATYTQSLPSQTRNTVQTKEKKLLKQPGYSLQIVTGEDGLAEFLRDYNAIYEASWKKNEPRPGFITAFVKAFAACGWARLGIVRLDGEPVAAQIWIVKDGVASIYKLAYDEKFSKLSAGSVLTYRLMEHVISIDEVHTVDYLTGDDNYKQAWMSRRRERWGILACNTRTLKGLVHAARHIVAPKLRRPRKAASETSETPAPSQAS